MGRLGSQIEPQAGDDAMSMIAMPIPDRGVLARRDAIVTDLARLVSPGGLIADVDGRRAFELIHGHGLGIRCRKRCWD